MNVLEKLAGEFGESALSDDPQEDLIYRLRDVLPYLLPYTRQEAEWVLGMYQRRNELPDKQWKLVKDMVKWGSDRQKVESPHHG